MNNYEALREILDTHPAGAPASPFFDEILHILFSEPEVALAAQMSFQAMPVARIAAGAGIDAPAARAHLEAMAERGVIYSRGDGDGREYGLFPTIPGLFEIPFMKKNLPQKERLAALWMQYHNGGFGAAFAGSPTPMMRVVPVQKSLEFQNHVLPYEEVAELIRRTTFRAQATCACRESVNKCDKPRDVCLFFDKPAKALVDRGFARAVSAEEAMQILDRAEAAGLVHTATNSADRATVICSCCSCCCTILRGRTELNLPHAFAPSAWIAAMDAGLCSGCGLCADERCPVKAIDLVDEIAVVDRGRCIGCGLCVSTCSTKAARLVAREPAPAVPNTVAEMGMRVVSEKGTAEKFFAIMSRAQK